MGKKKGAKGESSKGKKARCANYTSKAPVDYDDDELLEEEEDEHPIFTYNNTPHFPTFKIELGEARYKVDELRGEDVLCVSRYTSSLNDFWKTKTDGDGTAQHGDIECVANLTGELCKGIVKAFGKAMNSSVKINQCALDDFSSPIEVIITKEDQSQALQNTEESKFKSICGILEQLYPPQVRNSEWTNMIAYLCKDKYKNDCCARLTLSEHWLFWHCSRRIEFISFLDSNLQAVFKAGPPLEKVWKHVSKGGSGIGMARQGGNLVAGSSNVGGDGALSKSRRDQGKLLIMKIRNCAEHVREHRPTYDANGIYIDEEYPNIVDTCPSDVYYKMSTYLPHMLGNFTDLEISAKA
ncbi:hypothetical protein POM88_010663 [Heracleum sosnowskyi]|uniref:Uncharacterized protein n=1 Tax=Heracleum sosnowskyi TaxID=360622 RepID=A0AAD8N0R4_9APIA|nr:hypothetical protein POM88_010663 [Heracleum sosnowskyi]